MEAANFRIEAERFVEFVNGRIEKLPTPTWLQHAICDFLVDQYKAWNKEKHFARLVYAPVPLKLFAGVIREPDISLFQSQRRERFRATPACLCSSLRS